MATIAEARPGEGQDPGSPSSSHMWVTGTQEQGSSSVAFLGGLAGSWIWSGVAGAYKQNSDLEHGHHKLWLNPLHHNASPTDIFSISDGTSVYFVMLTLKQELTDDPYCQGERYVNSLLILQQIITFSVDKIKPDLLCYNFLGHNFNSSPGLKPRLWQGYIAFNGLISLPVLASRDALHNLTHGSGPFSFFKASYGRPSPFLGAIFLVFCN